MDKKLAINCDECAKLLGIGLNTMRDLTHKEGFPAIRVSSHRIVIPVDKLKEWLNENAGNDIGA